MTVDDLCRRVYAGRSAMRMLGCDPSLENVNVVIHPDAEHDLRADLRRNWYARNLVGAIAEEVRESEPALLRVFGLPVVTDGALMPNEIRFRSEVVL